MTFDGTTPDFASIYAGTQASGQPDLMARLAKIGVTSLDGLSDSQLQDIAGRLQAYEASQSAAPGATPTTGGGTPAYQGGPITVGDGSPVQPGMALDAHRPLGAAGQDPNQVVIHDTLRDWTVGQMADFWNQYLTTGVMPADAAAQARRRSDGSLNPQDMPGSYGLTNDQMAQARRLSALPNAVLATGQNEGVAVAPNLETDTANNNAPDLLAQLARLKQEAAAGTYKMLNDPSRLSGSDPLAQQEVERNIQVTQEAIDRNKGMYLTRLNIAKAMGVEIPPEALSTAQQLIAAGVKAVDNSDTSWISAAAAAAPSAGSSSGGAIGAAAEKLQGYISNLQAVKNRTPQQQAELQSYQQRLQDYQSRGAAAPGTTPAAPGTAPQAPAGAPVVSQPVDATKIATLQGYIKNLQGAPTRTPAQDQELAAYTARLKDYQSRGAAPITQPASTGSAPAPTMKPATTAGAAPITQPVTPPTAASTAVDPAKIAALQGYISNLSKVAQPTAAQTAELATYKTRLEDYQSR